MTPVVQSKTLTEHGYGSCFTAAIASVLDLPERAIPVFTSPDLMADETEEREDRLSALCYGTGKADWWYAFQFWLRLMGLRYVEARDPAECSAPFVIASGLSPRPHPSTGEEVSHAVVYARQADGTYTPAHDPYPTGGFLVGEPRHYGEFLSDPTRS